nr:hypothetical protein [Tanacetum cinerariifolium]
MRRSQIPNLDPTSGLFLRGNRSSDDYDFLPLDIRIPSNSYRLNSPTLGCRTFKIWDSCNGLLLCWTNWRTIYVYNPSINNMSEMLPQNVDLFLDPDDDIGGLKITFDRTKSICYKVMDVYKMSNDDSRWSVKYFVTLDEGCRSKPSNIQDSIGVLSIMLGEREEDSFLVMFLDGKVVRYNFVLQKVSTLTNYCFSRSPFITSFARVLSAFHYSASSLFEELLQVDDFACPARFLWHTAKNVTRDPALRNSCDWLDLAANYTLDEKTYPLFLEKDREDMDVIAFIHTPDPTKVKVVERERKDDKPWFLETTVGRTIPLLPVVHDRGESELNASVDKLFDEGSSGTDSQDYLLKNNI